MKSKTFWAIFKYWFLFEMLLSLVSFCFDITAEYLLYSGLGWVLFMVVGVYKGWHND